MATFSQILAIGLKPRPLTWKVVLKFVLLASLVILILHKLIYLTQISRKRVVVKKASSDDFDAQSTQQLNAVWSWDDSHLYLAESVFVLLPFNNAKHNINLQQKFQTCVTSMSEKSSVPIVLFVVGDAESQAIAASVVGGLKKKNVKLCTVDLGKLGEMMKQTINNMKKYFSYSQDSYYKHTLFFVSIAIHRLAPPALPRLIMLDADLKFHDDIKRLNELFDRFLPSNLLGIARENQPVYRHVLSQYRQAHPGTRAGEPPPDGLTGFNSGVLLLDLDRLRQSKRYNAFLDNHVLESLSKKYTYVGHLGDQDFYTLISLENEDLFFVLPCGWNRQLCRWWLDKGYEDVFDKYYTCPGKISIYHGNCNTPIS